VVADLQHLPTTAQPLLPVEAVVAEMATILRLLLPAPTQEREVLEQSAVVLAAVAVAKRRRAEMLPGKLAARLVPAVPQ
jgi:hypothetical protein